MVKIRLKRTGGKNWISFRIVVCDIRKQRDGKMVEELGYYDPKHSDEKVNTERVEYWVSQGAQMSDTVKDIYARAKAGTPIKFATAVNTLSLNTISKASLISYDA